MERSAFSGKSKLQVERLQKTVYTGALLYSLQAVKEALTTRKSETVKSHWAMDARREQWSWWWLVSLLVDVALSRQSPVWDGPKG